MSWTVREVRNGRTYVIDGVRNDNRGIFGVPVTPDGIDVTVELIRRGAYDEDYNTYFSIIDPTPEELEILDQCGWTYDGAFAFKK